MPTPNPIRLFAAAVLAWACATASGQSADQPPATPPAAAVPADFATFERDIAPLVRERCGADTKHWRQIAPAVHHLATQHANRLDSLPEADRLAAVASLASFIDRKRAAIGDLPVLAAGRRVIGLLDPARGLDPREITTIAAAYAAGPTTIFKQDAAGETIAGVADEFLAAVRDAAGDATPTTIIVLGHGLPTEIQSYSIRFERLADSLLEGAARRTGAGAGRGLDLGSMVLVCDDCFSADFLINLCDCLVAKCRDRGLAVAALPVCIAGTNRSCVGHADVGEKFVPHFWRDVIELYFIRRPRPQAIALKNFFDNVDRMMYGYGRAPVVEGTAVVGYRLIDPALVQDPVVFVPLDERDLAELRRILGLPADAPLPRWLDVG